MTSLNNTTFLIPLLVESEDRYNNSNYTLRYLNYHFTTNVILYEVCENEISKLDFLKDLKNLSITHIKKSPEEFFHRTKYLNEMLDLVETPIVVVYDIDIVLPVDSYLLAEQLIREGRCEVVYPFGYKDYSQIQVLRNFNKETFLNTFNTQDIELRYIRRDYSAYGFCIFFSTEVYRKNGGENENFKSWGPEDVERGERFHKLGYRINWFSGNPAYHFEHSRGSDSNSNNPYFNQNEEEYRRISSLDRQSLINYYKSQGYLKNYKNIQ